MIDRIWASGGGLADLVDRQDVSYILVGFLNLFVGMEETHDIQHKNLLLGYQFLFSSFC